MGSPRLHGFDTLIKFIIIIIIIITITIIIIIIIIILLWYGCMEKP